MNELSLCKHTWENLAEKDPLWAVLTDHGKTGQQWDEKQFFETGRTEMTVVFRYLDSLKLRPRSEAIALDFGCGVGRLTQALAEHCGGVYGVDISDQMVAAAMEMNRFPAKCHYLVNDVPDLSQFDADSFDFIYTSIVLQHVPIRYSELYLQEFVRVLKPNGVLVFQVPDIFRMKYPPNTSLWRKFRNTLRLRTRLRSLLSRLNAAGTEKNQEMLMNSISESRIREIIARCEAKVVDVKLTNSTDPDFNGQLRYLPSEPTEGWVSKQYCVVK